MHFIGQAIVDKFCVDAANAAICTKFKPLLLSGEVELSAVADLAAGANAADPLCRRAGAIKIAFPEAQGRKRADEFAGALNKVRRCR